MDIDDFWDSDGLDDFDDPLSLSYGDDRDLETVETLKQAARYERKMARRQFVNGLKKQALNELIPTLPPPDTDLYVIGNGAGAEKKWTPGGIDAQCFDFGTFIPHLVELLGGKGCKAYISTWVMNRNHALTLIELLNSGAIHKLTVLTDPYFKRRESAVCSELIIGMQRHEERTRFLAFKNHVKAICITNADETQFATVTGSANLSAQPRCEQYVLTTDPGVYRFFRDEFFEAMAGNG